MDFRLKNYTTGVSAIRSIAEIEVLLASFGASAVLKEFLSDGTVQSLSFKFKDKGYKLPANVEGVFNVMYEEKKQSHRRDVAVNRVKQAYNTAWRIIRDWVNAQLSIIASGQAQPEEVLLPYLWDGKRTLYQAYKDGGLKIAASKDSDEPD